MKLAKILVLLALVALGAFYFFYQRSDGQILLDQPFVQETLKIDNKQIEQFASSASEEIGILTERGKEVGEHAQNVLGNSVSVNEEQPPIHERAIEYGRYVYCKEVVKDFESKTPQEP